MGPLPSLIYGGPLLPYSRQWIAQKMGSSAMGTRWGSPEEGVSGNRHPWNGSITLPRRRKRGQKWSIRTVKHKRFGVRQSGS